MNAPALPAYLTGKTNRGLAQSLMGNLGVGSPPFLSIMGNRLTLIDATGEEIAVPTYDPKIGPYLDVCIIDANEHTSKIYYDKPFDPGANQYEPPACWSDNGVAPSRNAAKPQSPTCASCPQGAWGSKVSAVSGKGVKACADIQKVGFITAGYEMPFLLRIPPNSRTNFRGYVNKFVGQPMDLEDVMTRITFEQGGIGTLKFEAVGWLDETTVLPLRNKLIAAKATDALVGRTDLPRQEALPAPLSQAEQPSLPAQVQQPAPFVPTNTSPPTTAAPNAAFQPSQATPPSQTSAGPAVQGNEQPAPQRRRRRTQAEMAQAQPQQAAQAPAAQPAPQQAPFMPAATPVATQPAPQGNGAGFGMAAGAPANPELSKVLDGLFGQK